MCTTAGGFSMSGVDIAEGATAGTATEPAAAAFLRRLSHANSPAINEMSDVTPPTTPPTIAPTFVFFVCGIVIGANVGEGTAGAVNEKAFDGTGIVGLENVGDEAGNPATDAAPV